MNNNMKTTFYTRLLSIGLVCLILTLGGCAKDEVDTTGTIFGKVTETTTGEPVSAATVTITPGGKSTTTGSNGIFEFQDMTPGQYELQVTKKDFTTNTKRISVLAGESASGDIALTPVVQNAKLELSVSSLNFGKTNSSLSFDIKNMGNAKQNWNISGLEKVDWLEVTPTSGSLEAGKSNAVKVNLLRDKLKETSETNLLINADKESVALKVTAEAESKASKIELNTKTLNFGKEYSSLTFEIKNTGNSGVANWTIGGVDVNWITVSPKSGSTEMGKASAVKVEVDRTKVKGTMTTHVLVNADGESLPVTINVEEAPQRILAVNPERLDVGINAQGSFSIYSYNGKTDYNLNVRKGDAWLKLAKTGGTVTSYVENDPTTIEKVNFTIERTGLAAGQYSAEVVVLTDLGEKLVTITMEVEKGTVSDVVTNGLFAFYTFEGNANDLADSGLKASEINSPTYVTNDMNGTKAIRFNKTDKSYLNIPDGMIDGRKTSISFWVKGLSEGHIFHVVKGTSNYQRKQSFCLSVEDGKMKFVAGSYYNYFAPNKVASFDHTSLSSDKWYMITLTSDFNETTYAKVTTKLYIDGEYVDTVKEDCNPFDQTSETTGDYGYGVRFQLGGALEYNGTEKRNSLTMNIDNLRIYDTRMLSASEVKQIYTSESKK